MPLRILRSADGADVVGDRYSYDSPTARIIVTPLEYAAAR